MLASARMFHALRGIFWVCIYAFVVIAPLLVARAGVPRPGQGFITDFSVALGFVALSVMVLQFGLVARLQRLSAPFGMDALIQYHRQIGYVALLFALVHPALVFANDPRKLALLHWPTAPNRARFAVSCVVLLVLLVATSVWRKRLRLSYEVWQVLHGLLATAVVVLALGHVAGVGYYASSIPQRVLWAAMATFVLGDILWMRVVRPWRVRRRPWRVAEVVPELGSATSVVLTPDGHEGMTFRPGQFGWLQIEQSAFSMSQHPFSFSGSAEKRDRLTITIKQRGDFTSGVADTEVGARAYVDGPYGSFSPDDHEGFGFILIGGGVGITPLMSILRTMRDRGDRRPCLLMYGSKGLDHITFREELVELEKVLALTVVHVLEEPPADWRGETGYIDAGCLERHLPERFERFQCFICGPSPMMDATEELLASAGIVTEHIHSERFDMV
jgi:predicted ferric reductase